MTFRNFHLLAFVVAFCLICGAAFARQQSAQALLKKQMEESGLEIGYNENDGRFVQIEFAEEPFAEYDATQFAKLRDKLFRVAELNAKAEIMRSLSMNVNISTKVTTTFSDDVAITASMTTVEVMSHLQLHGFVTLSTAESWNDGMYQVAVAIGWSPKSESMAIAARESPYGKAQPLNQVSAEWGKWAADQDLSLRIGAYVFEDSEGFLRYVGIGVVDVENKYETQLSAAMTLARTKATANLCYALFGDKETKTLATQYMQDVAAGKSVGPRTSKQLVDSVFVKCKSIHIFPREVYTATVTHPLTGRKLFISVVGIEPCDMVKTIGKLAGTGGTISSSGLSARPDHESFSSSDRPNHSFRPSSNRPQRVSSSSEDESNDPVDF